MRTKVASSMDSIYKDKTFQSHLSAAYTEEFSMRLFSLFTFLFAIILVGCQLNSEDILSPTSITSEEELITEDESICSKLYVSNFARSALGKYTTDKTNYEKFKNTDLKNVNFNYSLIDVRDGMSYSDSSSTVDLLEFGKTAELTINYSSGDIRTSLFRGELTSEIAYPRKPKLRQSASRMYFYFGDAHPYDHIYFEIRGRGRAELGACGKIYFLSIGEEEKAVNRNKSLAKSDGVENSFYQTKIVSYDVREELSDPDDIIELSRKLREYNSLLSEVFLNKSFGELQSQIKFADTVGLLMNSSAAISSATATLFKNAQNENKKLSSTHPSVGLKGAVDQHIANIIGLNL